MAKKTHSGEENDRKIPPAEARPKTIGSGDAVLDALARLRGVRAPDKGKLGLREAMAVARQQGAAYERWKARGTPVRSVQILVEGRRMTTASSDDVSANIKSFHFDVASQRDAVMQILKADEGEEPVVLRNQPLEMVPPEGLDDPILLPNGQRIALKIVPTENGRFDVRIAFSVGEETPLPIHPPKAKGATAKAAAAKKMSNDNWYPPTPMHWRPQPNAGLFASAFVILFLVLAATYSWTRLTDQNAGPSGNAAMETAEVKKAKQKRSPGTRVTSKLRKKGDRSQSTEPATQTVTDPQEAQQVADNKDAGVSGGNKGVNETKEAGDSEVAVEQTMQSAIRAMGERVGAESSAIPTPSVSHGQNKSTGPLNYSSPSAPYLDQRLKGVENSSRDTRTFSYSGRTGSGFFKRQQD
jgi:hypothetical protein